MTLRRGFEVRWLGSMMAACCLTGCAPSVESEMDRFCQIAERLRGEDPDVRPAEVLVEFESTRSEPMEGFVHELDGRIPREQMWPRTQAFAAEHGMSDWQCPALEQVFRAEPAE